MGKIVQLALVVLVIMLALISLALVFDWITFDVAKNSFVRSGLTIVILASAAQIIHLIVKKS